MLNDTTDAPHLHAFRLYSAGYNSPHSLICTALQSLERLRLIRRFAPMFLDATRAWLFLAWDKRVQDRRPILFLNLLSIFCLYMQFIGGHCTPSGHNTCVSSEDGTCATPLSRV